MYFTNQWIMDSKFDMKKIVGGEAKHNPLDST